MAQTVAQLQAYSSEGRRYAIKHVSNSHDVPCTNLSFARNVPCEQATNVLTRT